MGHAFAGSTNSINFGFRPIVDTIIKLDSLKNKKSTKGKKSSEKSGTKTAADKKDTSKKSNELQEEVTSHAEDSTIVDQTHQITYLYGNARVTYGDFELDADFIRVDKKNHLLFAKGSTDPVTKRYIGRPISKQGKEKPLLSDSLFFDYKSKKESFLILHQIRTEIIFPADRPKN